MKKDIILAGVGGQGILSIATIIGYAAVETGLFLKQAEVHGMSQRGGDVQSHLRISHRQIYSDLIPHGTADIILSVEPMEALRYLPYLSSEGWLITNTTPYKNIPNYPELTELLTEIRKLPHQITIDADALARELGATRSMNMIMLGASSPLLDIDYKKLEDGISFIFSRKGEDIVDMNLKAMQAGRDYAREHIAGLTG